MQLKFDANENEILAHNSTPINVIYFNSNCHIGLYMGDDISEEDF